MGLIITLTKPPPNTYLLISTEVSIVMHIEPGIKWIDNYTSFPREVNRNNARAKKAGCALGVAKGISAGLTVLNSGIILKDNTGMIFFGMVPDEGPNSETFEDFL